jgi:signal peptidase I
VIQGPRRWDVIAFTREDLPDLIVKRVVGLPGETIEIRHGNIYADGALQRRNLRQQQATRVLVHDVSNVPEFARWRPSGERSDWGFFDGRWMHAEGPRSVTIDWLSYHHPSQWVRDGRSPDGPITDLCYYNQGRPRLEEDVHLVIDIMLSVRVAELEGNGLLWLKLSNGVSEYSIKIDPKHATFVALDGEKPMPGGNGSLSASLRNATLEMSIFDEQFLFACNGKTLICIKLPEKDSPEKGSSAPLPRQRLAIGAQGLHVVFDAVQVFRNIYYTPAADGSGEPKDRAFRLGGNEYMVLGDNSTVSDDSRTWAPSAVCGGDIVGRPLMVIYSPSEFSCFDRHFQVPDLAGIRYIR